MRVKKYIRKSKNNVYGLLLVFVLFLLLALLVPIIGTTDNAPGLWVSIVNFAIVIRDHFTQFWMFYSFAAVVFFAYLGKKKK